MYTAINDEIAKTIGSKKRLVEQLQLEVNVLIERAQEKLQEKSRLEEEAEQLEKELRRLSRENVTKSMNKDGISMLANAPLSAFDGRAKANGI